MTNVCFCFQGRLLPTLLSSLSRRSWRLLLIFIIKGTPEPSGGQVSLSGLNLSQPRPEGIKGGSWDNDLVSVTSSLLPHRVLGLSFKRWRPMGRGLGNEEPPPPLPQLRAGWGLRGQKCGWQCPGSRPAWEGSSPVWAHRPLPQVGAQLSQPWALGKTWG